MGETHGGSKLLPKTAVALPKKMNCYRLREIEKS